MNDLLKGPDCKTSSMRTTFVVVFAVVIAAWAAVSIHEWTLVDIPDNVLYLLVALTGGKVGQKTLEKPSDSTTTNIDTK